MSVNEWRLNISKWTFLDSVSLCVCVCVCVWETQHTQVGSEWKKGPFCVSLSDSEVFCQILNGIRYTGWDSIARLIS